jgi:methylmalonyl-CoA mutase N-terminal domain/subunit
MKKQDTGVFETYLKGEALPHFETLSGIEMNEVYTRDDIKPMDELPGTYPFTRGIHKEMYRKRLWTRRQQSGFGTPKESNERLLYLFKQGQTGINMDTDMPSKLGFDPDHPLAVGSVGLVGTSIATLEDMEELYHGIPLDKVSSTLIVQPPCSAVTMAQYFLLAKKQGVPFDKLIGTIMNCAFSQLAGTSYQSVTDLFDIDKAVKIGVDVMEFCVKNTAKWNLININAYNIRETAVNAIQEAAFSISLAIDYIKLLLARGLEIDSFAPRMAFFICFHMDFFEEIAKIRAMRRIWARVLKERFGAKNMRSMWLRTAIQTAALPLTAQQPLNNIVRAGIQSLGAVLSGVQSIHTTSYDEAYSLPTEEAHKLSIRTQQIIGYETNVTKSVDPLGGSYMIENLTNELEEKILDLIGQIESKGGFIECFKKRWIEEKIDEARFLYAKSQEERQSFSVGVNIFREEDEEVELNIFRHASDMQEKRIQYIKNYRKNRNGNVKKALNDLHNVAKTDPDRNLFELIMNAVEADATVGEIIDTLRDAYNVDIPHF